MGVECEDIVVNNNNSKKGGDETVVIVSYKTQSYLMRHCDCVLSNTKIASYKFIIYDKYI